MTLFRYEGTMSSYCVTNECTVYGFTSVNSWGHITHNTIYNGDALVFVHTTEVKHTSVGCILLYTHLQYYIVKYDDSMM